MNAVYLVAVKNSELSMVHNCIFGSRVFVYRDLLMAQVIPQGTPCWCTLNDNSEFFAELLPVKQKLDLFNASSLTLEFG